MNKILIDKFFINPSDILHRREEWVQTMDLPLFLLW